MDNGFNDGRPPVPGEADATQRRTAPAPQTADKGSGSHRHHHKDKAEGERKGSGLAKPIIAGALAGVIASAALGGVLVGTGVIGGSNGGTASSGSGASQTLNINANDQDTSVAKAVAAKAMPSVVTITTTLDNGYGIGSGVILDTDGNIVTNYHVIDGAQDIKVTINGNQYDATLVGGDESSDIAVVKAEVNDGTTLTPIEVGDSSQLVVGDWVMSLGSPLGLEQSASSGIVSALYRNTTTTSESGNSNVFYTNLIQTDASINQGNSGGALVNDQGQLVGICTLYSSEDESFSGIGFAIPGNYAVDLANKIIKGEPITHAYMGVSVSTVNAQNAQANHLSVTSGAYVASVTDGGAAANAGIQQGDIITKVGDTDVSSADDLILAVRSHSVGDSVDVTFTRGNDQQTVSVTLGSDEGVEGGSGSSSNSGNGSDSGSGNSRQETLEELLEEYFGQGYGGQGFSGRGQSQGFGY